MSAVLQSCFNNQQLPVSNDTSSAEESFLDRYALGLILLSLHVHCDRTAPIPVSEASSSKMNWLVHSGRHSTGAGNKTLKLLEGSIILRRPGELCVGGSESMGRGSKLTEISNESLLEIG